MVEQCPVQTSAVYLLGAHQFPSIPPPSPPSPATPEPSELCTPIEDLDLGEGSHHVSGPATISDDRLAGAVHVLATEATTLQCLARLYSTDPVARDGFSRAVAAVTRHRGAGGSGRGKLVVVGVGKSGHIGRKLVATFNSLGVHATFLHPTEALHGDLGQIGPDDTLLLITFSGRTPELLALLPHLDPSLPLILLTAHTRPETCELLATARRRRRTRSRCADADDPILLPAPVHEAESVSFGVSAPTSSTTAALAVGDALAIVAAQELHGRSVAATDGFGSGVGAVFAMNHPGGAIGALARRRTSVSSSASSFSSTTNSSSSSISPSRPKRPKNTDSAIGSSHRHHRNREIRHLVIPWCDIPTVVPSGVAATGADVLCAAYASASGWVRLSTAVDHVIPPSKIRRLGAADLHRLVSDMAWLTARRADFVAVAADTSVRRAAEWVGGITSTGQGGPDGDGETEGACGSGPVVGVVERGECIGVLEVEVLLAEKRG